MGVFNFFKKKNPADEQAILEELKSFSLHAVKLASGEIEETNSFLPFGGTLTTDNEFQQIVYMDPTKKTIDQREHATIVQKLIQKKYKDPKCRLIFIAFDGIAHLPTGDIDSINVSVDNRSSRIHKLLMYPYKIINGRVELVDQANPIIKDI